LGARPTSTPGPKRDQLVWQVHYTPGYALRKWLSKISLVIFALFIPFFIWRIKVRNLHVPDRSCQNRPTDSVLILQKSRVLSRPNTGLDWHVALLSTQQEINRIDKWHVSELFGAFQWLFGTYCHVSHLTCSGVDFMIWNYNYFQNGNSQDYYYLHWNLRDLRGKKKVIIIKLVPLYVRRTW
jgi:hypothetical protein